MDCIGSGYRLFAVVFLLVAIMTGCEMYIDNSVYNTCASELTRSSDDCATILVADEATVDMIITTESTTEEATENVGEIAEDTTQDNDYDEEKTDLTEEAPYEETKCLTADEEFLDEDYEDSCDETYDYCESIDTDLLARVIYCESGICSEYCQWLVGSVAMNLAEEYGSLESVAFNYNIFNVANILYTREPSELSYSVAERIVSGDRNTAVKAFRTDYYHSFGQPYESVDNVYFTVY